LCDVVGAQRGLEDRQGALVQGTGAVEIALGAQNRGEVVEAVGGVVVIDALAHL
jgi:hypothetical protein